MAHATRTELEKVEKKPVPDSFFVSAEHFLEDWARYTQDIGRRAFEIFNDRGRQWGHELEDWLKAESEILRRVPIEMKETDAALEIRAQVAGFTAEDLKVSVEPRRITLKGETEAKTEKKDDGKLYSEWRSNKIFRVFDLPRRVDPDNTKATIKDGVLTLILPKLADEKPNDVKVEAA